MNDRRSALPAHRLEAARHELGLAKQELEDVRDSAEAGGDWHRQLEAALAHLRELERLVADAQRRVPDRPGSTDSRG